MTKPALGHCSTTKRMSSQLEPTIWSDDSGQQIGVRCQLSNIKGCYKPGLHASVNLVAGVWLQSCETLLTLLSCPRAILPAMISIQIMGFLCFLTPVWGYILEALWAARALLKKNSSKTLSHCCHVGIMQKDKLPFPL